MHSLRTRALVGREAEEAAQLETGPQAATAFVRTAVQNKNAPEQLSQNLHRIRLLLANALGTYVLLHRDTRFCRL